jgi:3-oxoacyl-[acyl-carrier-protein] synthase III
MSFKILATSSIIGENQETNESVEQRLNLTSGYVFEKTGIKSRYHTNQKISEISESVALNVIKESSINPENIGLVIVCAYIGDYIFPSTAAKVAGNIGAINSTAFDLNANCTGFLSALQMADGFFLNNNNINKNVLIIGVAKQSPFLNPLNVDSALFFSDGAGAVILGPRKSPGGLLKFCSKVVSNNYEAVRLRGGGAEFPSSRKNRNGLDELYYEHLGLSVWKETITEMPKIARQVLKATGWEISDIDLVISHQANAKMLTFIFNRLGIDQNRAFINVNKIGNTADASIVIALDHSIKQKLIKDKNKVLFLGVGAGYVYQAATYEV